ncbi:MAG: hypothetical protein HY912_07160 [Desulfomonile tiedjei]|uniref:Uncharacterized protein n=1 Tax=Desulfomonile tiedjei TaxID=2358 RepID=A0A9D6Z5K8_9BACT|nr:hypothetical protein [Desulfomonile tiedjei]
MIYRVILVLRTQREREAAWDQMMSPEELRTYVENLKRESESDAAVPESDPPIDKKST